MIAYPAELLRACGAICLHPSLVLIRPRMCGRVTQRSGPLRLAIVDGMNVHESRVSPACTRASRWRPYCGAPIVIDPQVVAAYLGG
jgi:hypothetical protein